MKQSTTRKSGRVVLILLLLFVACGMLLPTILTAVGSFMSQAEITKKYGAVFSALSQGGSYIADSTSPVLIPEHGTLAQYLVVLLQTPAYLSRFWNSICLVVPIVLGQVSVAAMASYSLYRCRSRCRSVIYFFYVIFMLLPYQVTLLPNYLVADFLGTLGTKWAILLPDIVSPFAVFLLTRHMRRIPASQLEAAALDGAGEWRIFWRICLPQCKSILWAVAILIFVDYWNMIEQPMILLNDPAQYPLSIYLSEINATETGVAFAVATLYMIPPLLLFFYGQKHFAAGFGVSASADEKEEGKWRGRLRRWVIPGVLAVFLTALGLLLHFSETLNPRFTPEVTLTYAMPDTIDEQEYALTLPLSALHRDDYGEYVLTVREKKQDSQIRYQVVRVPVSVLTSTDTTVAVWGNLSSLDMVVETYTTLPEENQYVHPVV